MSRKHLKANARHVAPTSRNNDPLPGEAGEEIVEKLRQRDMSGALDIFWDAYIGDLGEVPPIQIIEDDGHNIIFVADRGMFKLGELGRVLLLQILDVMNNTKKEP